MPGLAVEPFREQHLDAAAELLAARHTRHRRAEPLLPERFEQPAAARGEIEALCESEGAGGVAAFRAGRLVGYLVGVSKDDAVWGANVWIEAAGHAVDEAEVARDLYAAAAERWVDEGRTRHYALLPATDAAQVDAWFRLGFGQQHAHAIRELVDTRAEPPEGVTVREADERDVDALVALGPLIGDHQVLSPVFSGLPPSENEDELRADILEDLVSPSTGTLVAEVDGRIVGAFVVVPVEASSAHAGLARPEGVAHLGWAATRPDVRGSGAGVALTDAAFSWARQRGYPAMVTDWRVTNLLSSRFWPKRGFRETFLRLYRSIP